MNVKTLLSTLCKLLAVALLLAACNVEEGVPEESLQSYEKGVFVLCEGNYNSGNASLSYYNTETKEVQNGVFQRVNSRKLGDTGQSITVYDGTAYIAVENSGIVWGIDTKTFRVKGQLTQGDTRHMVNPRYIHMVSPTKAYITDLYSPYITIFNPQNFSYIRSIPTGQEMVGKYANTEQMAQWDRYVFVACWSYSNKILVIDSQKDQVCDSIVLTSIQPKSLLVDKNDKLWVITDGGYTDPTETPHLYRIDARTRTVELDLTLPNDEANVQLALSPNKDKLYLMNNDIYRMDVNDESLPTTPFILAPTDQNGKRHMLYGIGVNPDGGDIYVADAVDYAQSGAVYRYSASGVLVDKFRVGIIPNGFAFSKGVSTITPEENTDNEEEIDDETDKTELRLVEDIIEYMPAPGHQVNGYTVVGDFIRDGASMREACDSAMMHMRRQWMVSLGAQGGYLIADFGTNIENGHFGEGPSHCANDYDLVVRGNPYGYQSEPGIVWVMADENGDGLPNDTWYELAGSEYGTANHTTGYEITYQKPTTPKQDISWTDNLGGNDIVPYMSYWNPHPYYWQDWVTTKSTVKDGMNVECRTYCGSRLKDTHTYDSKHDMSNEPPFDWGYADNGGKDTKQSRTYLRLDNAKRADGQPANLSSIRFVKIQTAQTGWTPNLGEISTEVYGIWGRK